MDDAAERAITADNRLGVRRVEAVTPALLQVTVGDALDTGRLEGDPSLVLISSSDDPAYREGRAPSRIGRRSRGECLVTDGWPYAGLRKHELFLVVAPPLVAGRSYRVDIAARLPLTSAASSAGITLDDRVNVDPAISVNQVGFLPQAARKYAYFGT
jgi:hypothetical protein